MRINPGVSCLFGLGGAGVAHALAPYLGTTRLDVVENDFDVIELCFRFFLIERIKNIHVIHQQAFLYLQKTATRYQHREARKTDSNC